MSNNLKKTMNFSQALSTVMGIVIGAGVFFKISSVASSTQSASLTVFVWVLAGLLSIASGLTVSELATALPVTGGPTKYIEYTYGKPAGFLFGWSQMAIYFPANIAALSIIFGEQFASLFGISQSLIVPIALIVSTSIMLLNFVGNKVSGKLQSITMIAKLIPIVLIIGFGLFKPSPVNPSLFPITSGEGTPFFTALSGGLLATMFAYDGWINVGNMAGEMKNPKKDLPRAIILGLSLVTLIYVLINYAFVSALPVDQLAGNGNAAFDSSRLFFGEFGGRLVTLGILVSVYGTINGYTMTGIRVPYTLASNGSLPFSNAFKKLNKSGAPYISGLFTLAITFIMIFLGSFNLLTDMLVFVIWSFTTLLSIGVIVLRKREPELERPYKVLFYPVIPAISILGGLFIVVSTLITQFELSLIGILVTLIGLPIYFYQKRKNEKSS
ncbi:amino acid permease [Holzapfeliella sp. He02]|uniref:Amino acid permease n=1 Tax=Holzapfeliella saturejae TaxID=3082953 RepID=A0ABU8SHB4_9LACO